MTKIKSMAYIPSPKGNGFYATHIKKPEEDDDVASARLQF